MAHYDSMLSTNSGIEGLLSEWVGAATEGKTVVTSFVVLLETSDLAPDGEYTEGSVVYMPEKQMISKTLGMLRLAQVEVEGAWHAASLIEDDGE